MGRLEGGEPQGSPLFSFDGGGWQEQRLPPKHQNEENSA